MSRSFEELPSKQKHPENPEGVAGSNIAETHFKVEAGVMRFFETII